MYSEYNYVNVALIIPVFAPTFKLTFLGLEM